MSDHFTYFKEIEHEMWTRSQTTIATWWRGKLKKILKKRKKQQKKDEAAAQKKQSQSKVKQFIEGGGSRRGISNFARNQGSFRR